MFTKFVTTFITSISKLVFEQTPEKKSVLSRILDFLKVLVPRVRNIKIEFKWSTQNMLCCSFKKNSITFILLLIVFKNFSICSYTNNKNNDYSISKHAKKIDRYLVSECAIVC